MELGEEEEEELRDGGNEGGSEETSPMEDRCVNVAAEGLPGAWGGQDRVGPSAWSPRC